MSAPRSTTGSIAPAPPIPAASATAELQPTGPPEDIPEPSEADAGVIIAAIDEPITGEGSGSHTPPMIIDETKSGGSEGPAVVTVSKPMT